jgi:uncharacterized protein YicC (UPF0701 family)
LHIELKSVNSRYLDCHHFRVCDDLRIAEPALRELIAARIAAASSNVASVSLPAAGSAQHWSECRPARTPQGFDAQVRRFLPLAAPLTVSDVLRWPGIFGDDSLDVDRAVAGLPGAGRRGARRFPPVGRARAKSWRR